MPASKHTKLARGNKKLSRQWQHVRSSAEARGASPGQAIRMASGVLKRQSKKHNRKRSKRG
jgi:hypothetical protein